MKFSKAFLLWAISNIDKSSKQKLNAVKVYVFHSLCKLLDVYIVP